MHIYVPTQTAIEEYEWPRFLPYKTLKVTAGNSGDRAASRMHYYTTCTCSMDGSEYEQLFNGLWIHNEEEFLEFTIVKKLRTGLKYQSLKT